MDLVVLRRLVEQLRRRIEGQRIDQIYALPRHDLALVLSERGSPRLWFSADPTEPHLYLREGGHRSPRRPPAFAMAARKWGRGQRVVGLEVVNDDRVVQLEFVSSARILFELVPRRACAFVVEPDGTVAAVWNPRRGRPEPGDRWVAPETNARPRLDEIPDSEWEAIAGQTESRGFVGGLMRQVGGMTHLVAREVEARRDESIPLRELVGKELERAAAAPDEPRVYAPAPPTELTTDPGARRLLLAPYPLLQAGELEAFPYPDLVAAAANFYATRARLRRVERVREAVSGAVRSRLSTIERTRHKVAERRSDPGDADRLRRLGDLLLACPGAEADGDRVRVPDVYGDGEEIEVAVDPARSLHENAERYYRRARRAERRVRRQAERLQQLEAEQARLEKLIDRAASIAGLEECDRLLQRAARAGLEVDDDRAKTPEAVAAPDDRPQEPQEMSGAEAAENIPGVRRFLTDRGAEILVGRSAKGNDHLTHRVAARDDWWLHARGPGSHVVLRNPRRASEPDPDQLRQAAALAAWFSKARQSTKCEVNWTRVRDVKRPRGGPPGLVLLGRHATILVEPTAPTALPAREVGKA